MAGRARQRKVSLAPDQIVNTGTGKSRLREDLLVRSRQSTPEERAEASRVICRQIAASTPWLAARSLLFYAPLPLEPNISPLLASTFSLGKHAALPRYDATLKAYQVAEVSDVEKDIIPGTFGIAEPRPECPTVPLNQLDLALVPGVGFDRVGRRLGRGKGYYDRLLADFEGIRCGVAFDWQLTEELPEEPHDIRMDWILTPTRSLFIERRRPA
jgi:5-formyltetrahydrofolate cyclo-ligase